MKSINILIALLSLFLVSCKKEEFKINHKKSMTSSVNLKDIKVVNELDPICQMKTADHLKDTAVYKNKTYGFCSSGCKETFKKNPEKYANK
ncbi:YHS domain-containing protein [Frigoriflavimonas asaccharolytica]|uniref:YHS domain-containing protein n=1 Tax=Frigoriflavimonas asaccharolytica TaxID=2735899 RepID=A0A8J8GA99_9FLAO|nr:YHS domain-containing protein [Frigoriflavimonas asaccharolytica]NRS93816.1 YHS domain-containing protein [Frigoriflavimonas asaccharolytica]